MNRSTKTQTLPLLCKTPKQWAPQALSNIFALLSDHAYLERKAASNALEMLNRWPEPARPKNWSRMLAKIAQDESTHLHVVLKLLQSKGGTLERLHKSDYANALRLLVRRGKGPLEILDRLLVSALIEARSCERFDLLAEATDDRELKTFYRSLWSSEYGHFSVFLDMARQFIEEEELSLRWQDMLQQESKIIQQQEPGSRIHSWV